MHVTAQLKRQQRPSDRSLFFLRIASLPLPDLHSPSITGSAVPSPWSCPAGQTGFNVGNRVVLNLVRFLGVEYTKLGIVHQEWFHSNTWRESCQQTGLSFISAWEIVKIETNI